MVESDEVSNKLSHIYVNFSNMNIKETIESDHKYSEDSPTKCDEDNSSEVNSIPNELNDYKTTNMWSEFKPAWYLNESTSLEKSMFQ